MVFQKGLSILILTRGGVEVNILSCAASGELLACIQSFGIIGVNKCEVELVAGDNGTTCSYCRK